MNLTHSKLRKNFIILLIFLSLAPFLYFFLSDSIISDFWYRLANISGFIGAIFILWQFILGVRGFSKWLTADYDWVIKIHTFLGINGALFVLLHPLLEAIYYKADIRFFFQPNFIDTFNTFLTIGKFAFVLFLIIWLSSSLFRKTLQYRTWLYIHYLSYPMALFVLIHPLKIGSLFLSSDFVFYYWYFIWVIFIIIFVIKILDLLGITYNKFKLVELINYEGDIFTLKYLPLKKYDLDIKPGQYFYIKKGILSEAHPFSVLEYNIESGEIVFGIKKFGKYTNYLALSMINEIHYIDGPFGEFTFEGQNSDPKVILAGGIGITPFYELILRFGNSKTYLFYANKSTDHALYRDKFKKLLVKNYFDFVSEVKNEEENVFCELITGEKVKRLLEKEDIANLKFFVCGSPMFTKSMISCLKEIKVPESSVYTEEFEY